jgi:hypothetical protein
MVLCHCVVAVVSDAVCLLAFVLLGEGRITCKVCAHGQLPLEMLGIIDLLSEYVSRRSPSKLCCAPASLK